MKTHFSRPIFFVAALLLTLVRPAAAAQTCPSAIPNSPGSGSDRYWFISWTYQGDAKYNLRWRPMGTASWTTATQPSLSNYTIQGLSAATTYEWQVQTDCHTTSTLSAWSASATFTTAAQQPCLTPVDAVATLVADQRATLQWTSAKYLNQNQYEGRWRAVGVGSWNNFSATSDQSIVTHLLTGLTAATGYEFQLRAVCSPGYFSDYTNPVQFTTLAPIVCSELTPTGLSNTEITSTNARFNWHDMVQGQLEKYNLRFRPVGAAIWRNVANAPVNTFPPTFQNLLTQTTYEWQVQTVCPEGDLSPWSALAQFTTLLCETPIQLKPLVYLNNKAKLSWSLLPGSISTPFAVRYRTQNPVGAWTTVPNFGNGDFISGLTSGLVYEWQVQKNCTSTTASDWVSGPAFTAIDCAYPPNGGVRSAVVDGGSAAVNLKWSRNFFFDRSGPEAVTFNLRYRAEGAATWTSLNGINDNGFNYGLYDLASNTTYEFQLQSNCRAGVQSAFSPTFRYRTVPGGAYYTLKDGDWNDYTVWSTAVVPEPGPLFGNYPPVEIRHNLTTPSGYTIRTNRINYTNAGKLSLNSNTQILLLEREPE